MTAISLAWMRTGTELFLTTLDRCGDLTAPTALEGWTGRHLATHVAANAEALLNLVHWARTGEPTPMYTSQEQRNADIEEGATRPPEALKEWVGSSAARLADGLAGLTGEQWSRTVRTAQGRAVPASEVPWMRSREVLIHAVDLDAGVTFADLPADFLVALIEDIAAKRSEAGDGPALTLISPERTWPVAGSGQPTGVTGSLADLAAYLSGRTAHIEAPDLPRWL
ncbi:maleylpyruvate isomerase [Nonomuraea solani]|uniref:Maleylpyruvate isomerase n=1 Tax=Nonomuraea solani TaxID=1144553 RepID=A0A1H6EWF8_9ACTN|nr:maleylpyruvate isomerase family mycothiol-dependent enzyme [Nonomuraea solani]SEH02177.1 maleylpyruvate isomerase [Nonomuraea solani]